MPVRPRYYKPVYPVVLVDIETGLMRIAYDYIVFGSDASELAAVRVNVRLQRTILQCLGRMAASMPFEH